MVRLSALGDVTLAVPLVRTLQASFPSARITWITSKASFALLEGLAQVEFVVIDKPRSCADYRALSRRMAGRRFDALLALQANLRVNLIYPLIGADIKLGFDRQRAREGQWLFTNQRIAFGKEHLLDSFLAFAAALGARQPVIAWGLPLGDSDHRFAAEHLRSPGPFLAVNPAASKPERNWGVDGYVAVLRAAHASWGTTAVLTGGPDPSETELAQRIADAVDSPLINLVGKTSPKQLAAVLQRAQCLLAPDTGPAHIAVAVGTPVVGLYAVAPPALSRPYLYPELVVNKYPDAVRELLGRDPDTVAWGTRVHDPRAMGLISAEDVLAKLALVLGNASAKR